LVCKSIRCRPLIEARYGQAVRVMQRWSGQELRRRRADVVAAVRAVTPIEFVNGGGSGSVEYTASDPAVTEVAAGSALFAPRCSIGTAPSTPARPCCSPCR
jgi:hypothetical protein